jgi:hypothetical protein
MDEPEKVAEIYRFTTHLEFEARFRECIARARATLQLFDPDFRVFPLGLSDVDAALRHFLAGGGSLQLAMHRPGHIERSYPRFLRLLKDYSHRVECRVTGKNLHQLTDSFCLGDRVHIVRRFHSDHMRGEAAFKAPAATEISLDRFEAIWAESMPGLHASTTGL